MTAQPTSEPPAPGLLRLPPAIVGLVFLFAIVAAANLLPTWRFDWPRWLRGGVASLLWFGGSVIAVTAVVQFLRERTTVDPLHPDRATLLVTWGAYRWSRNPMYVGFAATLLALAIWLAHPISLLLVVVFVVVLDRFQIVPEEQILRQRFGATYERYCDEVRRWL